MESCSGGIGLLRIGDWARKLRSDIDPELPRRLRFGRFPRSVNEDIDEMELLRCVR